jgi:hypothetical protein
MANAQTETSNTRLTIDLPSNMHRMIKAHATLSDLSIKDFIIETVEMRFSGEKAIKKDKISKNKMNAKTIAVIENSIKNHNKLKSFNNTEDAMNWLTNKSSKRKNS